ncbi:MAG: DUF1292 domain-containing protein [Firmicutes bacterium]|nr:DUF1292 domain-containing protein [Bacillota bacterium]
MAEETDLVTLVDEEGKEHHFELIDVIEVDERRYAVMTPVEEERAEDEEGEAYIFRLETDENGEEILVDVDDEDEFDRVCAALEELDEDFDDEGEE